jgi:hypothetical protein
MIIKGTEDEDYFYSFLSDLIIIAGYRMIFPRWNIAHSSIHNVCVVCSLQFATIAITHSLTHYLFHYVAVWTETADLVPAPVRGILLNNPQQMTNNSNNRVMKRQSFLWEISVLT